MNQHILTTSTATTVYKPSPSHTDPSSGFISIHPASLFASLQLLFHTAATEIV